MSGSDSSDIESDPTSVPIRGAMPERADPIAIPRAPSRAHLSPPVFPPGCYRAASRRSRRSETAGAGVDEGSLGGAVVAALSGNGRDSHGIERSSMTEPETRTPGEVAEALESLARELRRRGPAALRSSPGAPRLEAELREFAARFVGASPGGH